MIYQMLLRSLIFISLLTIQISTVNPKIYLLCSKLLTKELRSIKRWLDANKLSLNIDKTNYVIFHSSSRNVPSDSNLVPRAFCHIRTKGPGDEVVLIL